MSVSDEIIKTIKYAFERYNAGCDKSFKSIVKRFGDKNNTYVILDESGQERTVKCCTPNLNLKVGTRVWVKIPCGKINDMHIYGIV